MAPRQNGHSRSCRLTDPQRLPRRRHRATPRDQPAIPVDADTDRASAGHAGDDTQLLGGSGAVEEVHATDASRWTSASQATSLGAMIPDVHHMVGAREIEELLGVSRQRVQQLINRPDFPQPVMVFAMGKAWHTEDVIAWAKARGREVRGRD